MNIRDLEAVSHEARTIRWGNKYAQALKSEKCKVMNPEPQVGPDGFSYLLISTDPNLGGVEPVIDIIAFCAEKGIGLVINPEKEAPDLIATYGMIWVYRAEEKFFVDGAVTSNQATELTLGDKVKTAAPSESFWPKLPKRIFKEFLTQQGVYSPRCVLLLDENEEALPELCFSLESLGNPPMKERDGILEAFSWFFPRHYSLLLAGESQLKQAPFSSI